MCFSPVLVQNTLGVTIYWGIDGKTRYFNFGSNSLSLYIYTYSSEADAALKMIGSNSIIVIVGLGNF